MTKVIYTLSIFLTLSFTLIACGNDDNTPEKENDPTGTTSGNNPVGGGTGGTTGTNAACDKFAEITKTHSTELAGLNPVANDYNCKKKAVYDRSIEKGEASSCEKAKEIVEEWKDDRDDIECK